MNVHHFNRFMAGLFLVIFVLYIGYQVREKPRVLILHSYDTDYLWVLEVSEGIKRVLQGKPYSIRWHYMDTKRHPEDAFKIRAGKSAQNVIDQWQPHVILAVADNAQKLVATKYINDPHKSIVFSGVFASLSDYGYDTATNVTGILERWPLAVIKESIENIFVHRADRQTLLRIHHIGELSTTGKFITAQIKAFDWGEQLDMVSVGVETFDEWKQEVVRANQKADLVLFSLYHTLLRQPGETEVVPPNEVMQWTQAHLKKPGLGGWGFYVEQGGMMAIGVSAFEQGEEAAKMVVDIIDKGRKPQEMPPKSSKQFLIYLREPLLNRYGIKVPSIFEAFARATNNYHEN